MSGVTRRLRVAYVVRSWPRLSQTFVVDEVLALERLGVDVTVFSLTRASEPLVQSQVADVRAPVHYVDEERVAPVARGGLSRVPPGRLLATVGYAIARPGLASGYANVTTGGALRAALRIARRMQVADRSGKGFDHLHAHFAHDPALVALLVHRLTRVPFTFTAHARDLYQLPPAALGTRARAARAVIVCSRTNGDYLRGAVPELSPARVHVIRHGVDVDRFRPPAATGRLRERDLPLVLSVGRLVDKKGFDDLLRACAHLVFHGVPFRCEIYGDGPLARQLRALRDELGLRGRVSLCGERRQRELVPLFQRADVFALASRTTPDGDRDGIPNVVAEAMACGVPVVATTAGAIGELVRHDVTGLLVPPRRADRLANELARLLAHEPLRRRLGAAGRRAMESEFDQAASARALRDVFAGAAERSRRPVGATP